MTKIVRLVKAAYHITRILWSINMRRDDRETGTSWTGIATLVLLLCLLLATTGCATTESDRAQLPVQYATIKLIEQSDLDAAGVLAHVQRVQAAIANDPSVSLGRLTHEARQAALIAGLAPSDQLLLNYLLGLVEVSLVDLNLLDEAQRLQALTVLAWVEQAARMAG